MKCRRTTILCFNLQVDCSMPMWTSNLSKAHVSRDSIDAATRRINEQRAIPILQGESLNPAARNYNFNTDRTLTLSLNVTTFQNGGPTLLFHNQGAAILL